jgi:tetratricopeptide (TPR) repeat protein
MTKPKSNKKTATKATHTSDTTHVSMATVVRYEKIIPIILFLSAFILFANTLGHDYTQDDAIVITENMFTQQGIKGIPGILTKDTFFGFFKEEGKSQLVSGGRYRPLTLLMFAFEYELFGNNPFWGHFFNVFWMGILGLLSYYVIRLLFKETGRDSSIWIAFIGSLVFLVHPIHTEAVANIKGRDEIIALLFSLGALYTYIQWIDTKGRWYWLVMTSISLFLGLMAKENAITFLFVLPLAGWVFRQKISHSSVLAAIGLLIPTAIFLWIRHQVIGATMGGNPPMELMNNPFVKYTDGKWIPFSFTEQYATITYTLGKYVQLLLWPHPLTHDYYPRHIGILGWSHPGVIASLIIYISGIIYALKGLGKRRVFSFALLSFLASLSIVSNIVFPVGTNMSERFLFMPSWALCLWLAYWMVNKIWEKRMPQLFGIVVGFIIVVFSILTISRNKVWKNNETLFLTDVNVSTRSAKLQNAAGGETIRVATETSDEGAQKQLLQKAILHLNTALEIHPTYKNAYLLRGNAHYYLEEYDQAIQNYLQSLAIDPGYKDALKNIGVAYRDGGRKAGEKEGDLTKALQYLSEALRYLPEDYEVNRLLGVASGISGSTEDAVKYFTKAVELMPNNADAWFNLSVAYRNSNAIGKSEEAIQEALRLDPQVLERNQRQ